MEEAISAGSTCGEFLIQMYRKLLNFNNEKQLCYNAIITQKNFCNTIHKDRSSVLSTFNQKKLSIINDINSDKKN